MAETIQKIDLGSGLVVEIRSRKDGRFELRIPSMGADWHGNHNSPQLAIAAIKQVFNVDYTY